MASLVEIVIDATDKASKQIDEVNSAMKRLKRNGGKLTAIMTGLTGSISALGPAVAGLGALSSTFVSAGVGAVAFGAVATSVIGNVVEKGKEIAKLEEKIAQADTTEERLKYKKQMANIYKGMTSAQKDALKSLNQFKSWWSSFTKSLETPVFKVMAEALKVVKNVMTGLKPAIKGTAGVLQGFLANINKAFDTGKAQKFMDFFNNTVSSNLSATLEIMGNLFLGFLNLLKAFTPLSTDMNTGLIEMTQSFQNWSAKLSSNKSFQKFIEYARTNGPIFLDVIGKMVTFISQLVSALAPMGQVIMSVIQSFLKWLTTSKMVQGALNLIKQAGEFLLNHLGALKIVLASVLAGFLAFRSVMAIISVFKVAVSIFKTLKMVITGIRTAFMLFNITLLASPITWIVVGIGALIAIGILLWKNWDLVKAKAQQLWNKIKQVWAGIKQAFITGVTAVINWFKKLPKRLLNIVIYMTGFLLGAIVALFIELGKATWQGILAIINFFKKLPSRAMNFVTSLKDRAVNGFHTMMRLGKNAINNGIDAVVNFFRELPSNVMNFIINLKNDLVDGFNNMMDEGKQMVSNGIDNIISAIKNFGSTFLDAGRGLLNSFTDGIRSGIEKAKNAISDGMQAVRNFLPFSPAKEGPLSDLDKSGEAFFPTWANGVVKKLPYAQRAIESSMNVINKTMKKELFQFAGSSPLEKYFNAILQDGDWLNDWITHIPQNMRDAVLEMGKQFEQLEGLQFTGGRQKVTVNHRHEHSGRVRVQGDSSEREFNMVSDSIETRTQETALKDFRQSMRRR